MAATCRTLAAVLLVTIGVVVAPSPAAAANPPVCAVYCDTRDPSPARQETFPVGTQVVNGRRRVLHVDDADGMAWGRIDAGDSSHLWIVRRTFDVNRVAFPPR